MNETFEFIKEYITLIRDVGLIIGIPAIIYYITLLNKKNVDTLKSQIDFLKETQYDRALHQIRSQKELYLLEKNELEVRINKLDDNLLEKGKHVESITKQLEFTKNRLQHYIVIEEDMLKIKSEKFNLITNDKDMALRFLDTFANTIHKTITDTNYYELSEEEVKRWSMLKKMEKLGFVICSERYDHDHDEMDYHYTLTDNGRELKQVLENNKYNA